jgi:ABC-type glycerol-3-phosphate transport system substrate-binding protein
MDMDLYKKGLLFVIILCLLCSCSNGGHDEQETEQEITTVPIDEKEVIKLDSKPLTIIYYSADLWGVPVSREDNLALNFIAISNLCEKKFGFKVKFQQYDEATAQENVFQAYIKAGLDADLVFPSPVRPSIDPSLVQKTYFWGDRYIEDGLYTDLTPYLRLCPEAQLNFEKYPYIKEMSTRNGKTYAIYTGMPSISVLALYVKKELLEQTKTDIQSLNEIDEIYSFMYNLYGENPPDSAQKILLDRPEVMTEYSIYNSGYYPLFSQSFDFLLRSSDKNYIPYPIEDTEVLDYLLEKFLPFFERSYFRYDEKYMDFLFDGSQDLFLSNDPLRYIKYFTRGNQNVFQKYSIVLLKDQKPVIDRYDSILPIMVPSTSTQPEKAMVFMQWLMTDEDVADILTFGSQIMNLKHYTFSEDGTILPEKNNTIYAFCHLIANFSKKAFLYGNQAFDIGAQYRDLTYRAEYPDFYKLVESQHFYYDFLSESYRNTYLLQAKRENFLTNRMIEWMNDPDSLSNADTINEDLRKITDAKALIDEAKKYISKVLESSY